MNKLQNSDLLRNILKAIYFTASRRTAPSFAIAVIGAITKTLEQRYGFLKSRLLLLWLHHRHQQRHKVSSQNNQELLWSFVLHDLMVRKEKKVLSLKNKLRHIFACRRMPKIIIISLVGILLCNHFSSLKEDIGIEARRLSQ